MSICCCGCNCILCSKVVRAKFGCPTGFVSWRPFAAAPSAEEHTGRAGGRLSVCLLRDARRGSEAAKIAKIGRRKHKNYHGCQLSEIQVWLEWGVHPQQMLCTTKKLQVAKDSCFNLPWCLAGWESSRLGCPEAARHHTSCAEAFAKYEARGPGLGGSSRWDLSQP